ncbi:hypothetical protein A3C91_02545 [Candidatus Azambacteria bacterium RIFCSPHIGHO2_02_FULL_52_12]|uniref:Haem-binding uptake Tiki superfamily ChaN domain-containing protein n=1 Tax=Candidatus Azambacteria bacterium RIFCSPLOWO2_01_FULL_46_25 TaxID=1797298 RepID=A0A1F5BVR0_9BACT|nr:MAG: hypothetical protein A3C91_02545 [Candidatus Azambacteria bacterium RIFCSPHIGHO2_02_FULL_52_12]OGD34697.1 MAG: hypothetical protein A2988_04340 [Candidatus Azambacteria bacterium RIFCSPLOWO2_01_FULL_46_25]OGD37467.1 MAG: hypothetical protein A2850_02770 [Candidatus Azambacteria bacterium RIFCSPHIGHO2_01_FULL_51_74]
MKTAANLIVIGTLHAGLTPEHELLKLLEKYSPTQLLVEIGDNKLGTEKMASSYPPEMLFAYQWAKNKGINVRGFDSGIDTLKEGLTEKDNQRAIEESKAAMKGMTWKDLNKEANQKVFEPIDAWLIDPEKEKARTEEMLANLERVIARGGTVVVVTGCGHLNDIRERFPTALFPLE